MKNAASFIAKRYFFTRKINFITIISFISVTGVSIGVAAMIIVLSVFNGFNKKVTSILIGFDPHIRIESVTSNKLNQYENIHQILINSNINNFSPFIISKGLLASESLNKICYIKGVDENQISKTSGIKNFTHFGKFDLKSSGNYGSVVIGFALANNLKTFIGDTLTIISPKGLEYSLTQFIEPVMKKFIIKGIFDSDNRDYDSKYAYISMEEAQNLFDFGENVSGIDIRIDDLDKSDLIKDYLTKTINNPDISVSTWYDLHNDFYSILKIERWVAFIILSLIIAVASFNILGSLTMSVIDKKRDIGILKTIGASDKLISKIFIYEGLIIGLTGAFIGTVLGTSLTLLQMYFGIYKLDSTVYKLEALPVELRFLDFILIPSAALFLCFISSIYPAKRAARQKPVESIRWE